MKATYSSVDLEKIEGLSVLTEKENAPELQEINGGFIFATLLAVGKIYSVVQGCRWTFNFFTRIFRR